MKFIKYFLKTPTNTGTAEAPVWEYTQGPECTMPYSEANMAIAEAEAYGEVTVEDDGQPEPVAEPTQEERLAALEAAMLEMILGGDADG